MLWAVFKKMAANIFDCGGLRKNCKERSKELSGGYKHRGGRRGQIRHAHSPRCPVGGTTGLGGDFNLQAYAAANH